MQGYSVKLDGFEGPLDLLLHLINQYEIDIYDIPVAVITEQYMHYIHTMQQLELNIASEYLVMAATLLAMKSKSLLPNQAALDEEATMEEEDPRDELMNRLIEYRKFKEAAEELKEKELSADKLYTRPPAPLPDKPELKPLEPGEVTVYDMVAALRVFFAEENGASRLIRKSSVQKFCWKIEWVKFCILLKPEKKGSISSNYSRNGRSSTLLLPSWLYWN